VSEPDARQRGKNAESRFTLDTRLLLRRPDETQPRSVIGQLHALLEMTDLIRIVQAQASFLTLLLEKKKVAADASGLENRSATHIQRLFRGTRIRIDVTFKR